MPKMIPHRLIHQQFEEHEVIKRLNKVTGRSLLDEDFNMVDIECEAFHIFPLTLKAHPVINVLSAHSKMFLESYENQLYLPLNPFQAYKLGKSAYADPPIDSYVEGLLNILNSLLEKSDFALCQSGDERALNSVRDYLVNIRTAMKNALETAKLYAAWPYTDEDYKRDEARWNNLLKQ